MDSYTDLLQSIAQTKATLIIITKTKNERFFIEKWIQHHLAIIGKGKLIIFDNMSDDKHVLHVYEKYKKHLILIKFNFYHNDIHDYGLLKSFYDAVGESTDFFTVLDSDEFLYFCDDNNNAIHDTSILDYLRKNKDCDFFAPAWLENIEGEENLLDINSQRKEEVLARLFDWGKPIINTKIFKKRALGLYSTVLFRHTSELPVINYKKAQTKFFIAHLKNLNKQQRILANMNKLVSNGLLQDKNDVETLFKLNIVTEKNRTLCSYIEQTQKLITELKAGPPVISNLTSHNKTITIGKDNKLYFSHNAIKQEFLSLLHHNYLELIDYDFSMIDREKYPLLSHWRARDTSD